MEFPNQIASIVQVTDAFGGFIKLYRDHNGFAVIEFTDQNGDKYTIAAFPGVHALAYFAGTTDTSISEIAADQSGDIRFNTVTALGIMFHTDGYLYSQQSSGIPESWQAVSYQNGWTDFGAPMAPVAYRKMPDGTVLMRGMAKGGTQVDGTLLFTLPAAYSPPFKYQFHFRGATDTRVDFDTDGKVTVNGMGALPAGSRLPMDGWRFPLIT